MSDPVDATAGRIHDVVVVGAGPAGAMAALLLAGRGASVLLVDRAAFPRYKVCGCCVNPRAIESLRAAGQGRILDRAGSVPLSRFTLGCAGRRVTIRQPLGVAISRAALDDELVAEARGRGATFLPSTTASLCAGDADGIRELRLRSQGESWTVRGRFVVAATGLTDTLREDGNDSPRGSTSSQRLAPGSKIGAGVVAPGRPEDYPPGEVFMACGREGYVGLVTLEDGSLNIAAALNPEAVRRRGDIGPLAAQILEQAGFSAVPGLAELHWKGTPPLTRAARRVAHDRVFRVGDSAGYVEPFTGEGIAWALAAGSSLAGLLTEALADGSRSPERAWEAAYRSRLTRTQLVCRGASLALRTPWLTRFLVRALEFRPGLARPVLQAIHRTPPRPSISWTGGVNPT